jgi:hypothetical protein
VLSPSLQSVDYDPQIAMQAAHIVKAKDYAKVVIRRMHATLCDH